MSQGFVGCYSGALDKIALRISVGFAGTALCRGCVYNVHIGHDEEAYAGQPLPKSRCLDSAASVFANAAVACKISASGLRCCAGLYSADCG